MTTEEPDDHRSPARVRETYDEIATHFSKTREYPWPEVEEFLDSVDLTTEHRVGLDVGCGNGRHTDLLADVVETAVGVDVSRELLGEARERLSETGEQRGERSRTTPLVQGDAAALPVAAERIDVGLYVATVHHLPTRERRVESLRELGRVLAPGGVALVSAWSTAHDRFDADAEAAAGFDTTVDWTLPGGETVGRFYHIYAPDEFERDLRAAGLAVENWTVSSGNCYARVRPER